MEQKYPYYLYPAIEEYREASGERKTALARRIAANIGDLVVLRNVLGINPEEFASFYPDIRSSSPSTAETIDSFIDRFADPAKPQPSEVEEIIVPVATYSIEDAYDEEEEPAEEQDDDTSAMLDSFLTKNPPKKNARKKARIAGRPSEPAPSRNANMSESLAKVMIKNGNYQKAIEIITELSLNNPKKSIYFADQIRFLKKLMANANS